MRLPLALDIRAIGYGLATFVAGYIVLSIPTTLVHGSHGTSIGETVWLLVQIGALLVPALAGGVGAYFAPARRVVHGALAGTSGMLLLLLAVAFLAPEYPAAGIPFLVALFALVASLGAILGSYIKSRVGP
ncbi:hypothetical protein GCM10027084_28820 [Pseudoxanthomonas sangjuensis]